jgi:hypothetical protein
LKNELTVLYSSDDHDLNGKPIHEIVSYMKKKQLTVVMPEVYKLAVLITIPSTAASVERSFSALKRIKSYCRSTQSQDGLSGLALISIESSCFINFDTTPSSNFKKLY